MTTFSGNTAAMLKAEELSGTTNVTYTNEGLEIWFTNEDTNQNEIADKLRTVFSDVKVTGRRIKKIVITRKNQVTNGLQIVQVQY